MRSETSLGQDGRPRLIPQSFAPVFPILSMDVLRPGGRAVTPGVLQAGIAVHTLAGRNAIALALRDIGVGPGDHVAVPAFHCVSMIAPIVAAGAEPVFFPVEDGLSPDMAALATLAGPRCRAVMAVHYFGLAQDFTALRAFCDARGLAFIEDCCHAFFGAADGRPVGSWGDYVIASTRKFFPVQEGGLLVSRRPGIAALRQRKPGLRAQVKSAFNGVERSLAYGRLWALEPLVALAEAARGQSSVPPPPPSGPMNPMAGVGPGLDDLSPAALSLAAQRLAPLAQMVHRRRDNYHSLAARLAGMGGVRLLAPTLPDGSVPYMLPLEIPNLADIFPRLEDAALPMLRFGQFTWPGSNGICAVAARIAATGLQLACHDGLTPDEIALIADTLQDLLASS